MRNARKFFMLILIGILGISLVVSAEELTIVGTGSGTIVLQTLADAFMQQYPDISVSIPPSIGSGGAIKAVGRDENVLGRVARPLKESEAPYGLTYVEYATIPVVFYTNTSVSIHDLSTPQILDIYSGAVTNWSEVGGNDARVRVVTREEGDSSLAVLLESLSGFSAITITPKAKTTFSDPETEETVLNTADVIAYGSYPNVKILDVNILTIDGMPADHADYPYFGPLGLIYKEANFTGALKTFVEFVASDAGHAIITEVGAGY